MDNKPKILVFTGAGVSKESGIKTFRDCQDGLWNDFKIEEVATPTAWRTNREKVLDFYNMRRRELINVEPNKAHKIIAELEKDFDVTVVTQNVDNLHERAGSTKVIHLHGELTKARSSLYSNKPSPLDEIVNIGYNDINIGDICQSTGSQYRPHIIWFGENLDPSDVEAAKNAAKEADACIIVGTSMQVSPANEMPFYTKESAYIWFVDPGDMNFYVPEFRRMFFEHVKMPATTGMEEVLKQLEETNF